MITPRELHILRHLYAADAKTALTTQELYEQSEFIAELHGHDKNKLAAQLTKMRGKELIANGNSEYRDGLALLTWHATDKGRALFDNDNPTLIDELDDTTGQPTLDHERIKNELKRFLDGYFEHKILVEELGEKLDLLKTLSEQNWLLDEGICGTLSEIHNDLKRIAHEI